MDAALISISSVMACLVLEILNKLLPDMNANHHLKEAAMDGRNGERLSALYNGSRPPWPQD